MTGVRSTPTKKTRIYRKSPTCGIRGRHPRLRALSSTLQIGVMPLSASRYSSGVVIGARGITAHRLSRRPHRVTSISATVLPPFMLTMRTPTSTTGFEVFLCNAFFFLSFPFLFFFRFFFLFFFFSNTHGVGIILVKYLWSAEENAYRSSSVPYNAMLCQILLIVSPVHEIFFSLWSVAFECSFESDNSTTSKDE